MRSTAAIDEALARLDDLDVYEVDSGETDLVRLGEVEAMLLSVRHQARGEEVDL